MPPPKSLSELSISKILQLTPDYLITLSVSQTISFYDYDLNLLSSLVAYTIPIVQEGSEKYDKVISFAFYSASNFSVLVKKGTQDENGDRGTYIERWQNEKRVKRLRIEQDSVNEIRVTMWDPEILVLRSTDTISIMRN